MVYLMVQNNIRHHHNKNNSNLLPLISYFEQGSKLLEEIEKKIESED